MTNRKTRLLPVLAVMALVLAGGRAWAEAPITLEVPLDCAATTCTIQKYIDHDPGPGRIDYACGRLTNDGDTGTDIRVPDFVAMERGVPVRAAAAGVVKRTRDGMRDISVREIGQAALAGKLAGNSVVLDHGNGWETQYSHLRQGSVAVRPGQRVAAGTSLGLVGMSGNSEFPHLNFVVRHQGRVVDPFVGLAPFASCRDPRQPLWSRAALSALPYQASGPLIAGFASERPDPEAARRGRYPDRLSPDAPMLVMWADLFGVLAGDTQRFEIVGPDGAVVHQAEAPIAASNISWFAFSGRKAPPGGWPAGVYRGTYELIRDGDPVVRDEATVTIERP